MKNTSQRLFIASISFSILLVLSISVVVDAYPSSQQLVLTPISNISNSNDQASDDQLQTNQINRAGGHVSNWSAVLDGATDVSTIVINGDHYVAVAVDEGKGLQLLNITNPSNILVAANKITTRSGFLLDSVKSVETITVGDKHYAVVAGYNAAAALDITNPHFIPEYGLGKVELKYFKDTLLLQPTDVSLIDVDSAHYAVATSFGSGGIQILDVTNPKYIKPLGNLNDNDNLIMKGNKGVDTVTIDSNHYAVVASYIESGIQILDITNPKNIIPTDNISMKTHDEVLLKRLNDVSVVNIGTSYYALTAGYTGVMILDITDPYDIDVVSRITDNSTLTLKNSNHIHTFTFDLTHYAMISSDEGVQILDITDPASPIIVTNIVDDDSLILASPKGIDTVVIDTHMYAIISSFGDDGIQIFRISHVNDGTQQPNPVKIEPVENEPSLQLSEPPTANAGNDQAVALSSSVTLDGSASSDPESDSLTYSWAQTSGPDVTLTGATTFSPTFTAPSSAGIIVFTLTVSDGPNSHSDTVTITVSAAPTADAGADKKVARSSSVTLDGSGSSDSSNRSLTYSWEQISGTDVTLSDVTVESPTFTAPATSEDLVFTLTVTASGVSATDTVTITISQTPTAEAGDAQTVPTSSVVTLSGTGSDPDGDDLSYSWEQTSGTDVTISGETTTTPSFTAPATSGDLVFTLTVSDGGLEATDTVTITVSQPPTAEAGNDQRVAPSSTVSLDGSGSSDPDDGDTISYSWEKPSGSTISLTGATTATPTFTAPATAGNIILTLTVTAGGLSSTDTVTITVSAPPTANAGNDQAVALSSSVTLNGSGSDPEGDSLTYSWVKTSGPDVTLSSTTVASPTFTAPSSAGIIVFTLTVSDGPNSATDTVTITVSAAPTANAGADKKVARSSSVTLDGSGSSDSSNRSLTYSWEQISGTDVTLSDVTVESPTFTAPATSEDLVFTLTVTAGGVSATDTVTVTVSQPPTASAGNTQTVATSSVVTLSGTGSDPDNDSLSYSWEQTAGNTVELSSTTTATPTFTAPATSDTLTFTLTVSDGGLVATDTVTITVSQPPVANAGTDQRVAPSSTVTLNGSASSDPDGETLSYSWKKPSGSSVTLSDSSITSPTFTAPATAGSLTFTLTVTAGGLSSTDDVTVTVSEPETFCNDMTLEQLMNPSLGYNVIDNRTGTIQGAKLIGTVGNDLILASDGGDTINAKEGDDCIIGGSGDDIIRAGNGDDIIYGGLGNDLLVGKKGNDTIYGGTGNDQIIGDQGNDTIYGQDGHDIIRGGTGDDIIRGGTGDDIIRGGHGDDIIHCGSGTDSVSYKSGSKTIAEDCETVPP